MVEVKIHRAPDGLVERFEARGHAGYAKAGKDIVCSAVTAVLFTAVGYAESLYNPENLPEKVCYSENDGFLEWKCPEISAEARQKLIPVFDAMVLGLQQIRASVNNRHLVVHEEEVRLND
jgi:hypothetical protein